MIKLTDNEGEVWINPHQVIEMRPFGEIVEIKLRDGCKIFAKNTSCDKLARRFAGSDM